MRSVLDGSGRRANTHCDGGITAVLSSIARDAIDILSSERRSLVRACEMDDCGGLFLDDSRGLRRRWCSMERCGNRAKAAAFRDRAR